MNEPIMYHLSACDQVSADWYVVQCKPLKEAYAAHALQQRLGLNVYTAEVSKFADSRVQQAPFFPGYVFVQADLSKTAPSKINSTPFVLKLLEFGGGPQRVPADVVKAIRERIAVLNSQGGLSAHNFVPGDCVRFKAGPYKDLEAIFVGPTTPSERVKVLLHFFNRINEVRTNVGTLEKASAQGREGVRRTRGQGRAINYKT